MNTFLSIVRDISITVSLWVAIYGIDAWRREYVGKRRIDLAEQVLSLFYEAHDAIRYIRSPFGFSGEGGTRKRRDNETENESGVYDRAYVVFERYEKNREVFNRLRSLRYQFMALHGNSTVKPFDELNTIVNDIFRSSRMLSHLWLQQSRNFGSEEVRRKAFEDAQKHEAVFWENNADQDPIAPRVEAAITSIENICRPIIESKGTLFSFINLKLWGRRDG